MKSSVPSANEGVPLLSSSPLLSLPACAGKMAEGDVEERDFACHIRTSLGLTISGLLLMIAGVTMIAFGYNAEYFATFWRVNATTQGRYSVVDQSRLEMYKAMNYVGSCVFGVAVFFFIIVLVVFLEYQQFLNKINGPSMSALERRKKSFYRKVKNAFKRSHDSEGARSSARSPELASYLASRRSDSIGSPAPECSVRSVRGSPQAATSGPVTCAESDNEDKGQANLLSPEWTAKKNSDKEEAEDEDGVSYIQAPSCPVIRKDRQRGVLFKMAPLPPIEPICAITTLPPSPQDALLSSPSADAELDPSIFATSTCDPGAVHAPSSNLEPTPAIETDVQVVDELWESSEDQSSCHHQVNVDVKVEVIMTTSEVVSDPPSEENV